MLDDWMKSGRHLPPRLRDFHAQKEVFKTMHEIVNVRGNEYAREVDWITGQCYVIDIFLWFMARRGYTLQRSRARLPFRSLDDDIAACEKRRNEQFAALMAPPPHKAAE